MEPVFVLQDKHLEVVGVYSALDKAKRAAMNRAGIPDKEQATFEWKEHNAHGPSWSADSIQYYVTLHSLNW